MTSEQLQEQCELGQRKLMETSYLQAERILADAEAIAWSARDFDTLARLYMPLQEARRQRRLRCGEGTVCLDLIAEGPGDHMDGRHVVENYPFGQLLVAGWGSIEPALRVRELQRQHELYVETFLAAVFPTTSGPVVIVAPHAAVALPDPEPRSLESLQAALPAHCLVVPVGELPAGPHPGSSQSFARVCALWDRLHLPFLSRADAEDDHLRRIVGYRRTIDVDYACELAHQKLSQAARRLVCAPRERQSTTV